MVTLSNENMVGRKIRITKADRSSYWYADKIGQTFTTTRRSDDGYIVLVGGKDDGWRVSDGNYELVEETTVGITVLADELGLQREYSHVSRKAKVGERILIVNRDGGRYRVGDVLYVINENRWTSSSFNGTGVSADRTPRVATNWDDGFGVNHTGYVVLEPSNIVIIDGERFRTASRKAAIGERVSVIADNNSGHRLPIGSIQTIERVHEGTLEVKAPHNERSFGWMARRDYTVLEPVAPSSTPQPATPSVPSTDELLTLLAKVAAQNVSLEKRVVSLEANVAGHEYQIGALWTTSLAHIKRIMAAEKRVSSLETFQSASETSTPKIVTSAETLQSFNDRNPLPTLSRQDVINRAKADVADRFITFDNNPPVVDGLHGHNLVEFIVNREKRTVVALLRLAYVSDGSVRATGKSRCAPDDVFNVYIGKAIALRRALGLPVPADYIKSPQPTEPQVGDIVDTYDFDGAFHMTVNVRNVANRDGEVQLRHDKVYGYTSFNPECGDRIIDDSRETAVSV